MRGIVVSGGGSSDFLAYASLAVALAAFVFTAYWSRRTERRLHLDEYWFRQLVAPKCIVPIMEFHDAWLAKMERIDFPLPPDALRELVSEYQRARVGVLDGAWISKIFTGDFYANCSEALDAIEDSLVDNLHKVATGAKDATAARAELRILLGEMIVRVLARAAEIHGGNHRPVSLSSGNLLQRLCLKLGFRVERA